MQYLWINPVSAGMCEEDSLKRFLERHGLTRVECRGDWGRIVRERYEASLRAGVTLADARFGCLKRYRRSRKTNLELKT